MSKVLYASHGVARLRSARAIPDAASWTPDNPAGEDAAEITLRGLDWQTARLVARFAGSLSGAESVEVEPLIAVPDPLSPSTRAWATLPKVTLAPNLATALIEIHGHNAAFRITALTLGTATDVSLDVTGGEHKAE